MNKADIQKKVDEAKNRIKGESTVSIDMQKGFQDMTRAINNLRLSVPEIPAPQVHVTVPEIHVPEPKVTVNVPEFPKFPKIPDIKMPESMDVSGFVSMLGYDKGMLANPLPVQIRDKDGRPVNWEAFGQVSAGGGGIVTIGGALATVGVVTINPDGQPTYATSTTGASSTVVTLINNDGLAYNSDNPLPVTFSASTTIVQQLSGAIDSVNVVSTVGLTDTQLRASTIDIKQVSGSSDSVNVVTTVGLTDTQLRASTIDIKQVSGSVDSVSVIGTVPISIATTTIVDQVSGATWSVFATNPIAQGDAATALRVVIAGNSDASVTATQAGTWNIGTLTSITNTVFARLDSPDGAYSATNPLPVAVVSETVTLSDTTDTVGTQQVSGAVDSVSVVGPIAQGDAATALRVVVAGNSDASVTATQAGTWNIGTVTTVTGISNTVFSRLDSPDGAYSGSNPLPVTLISGTISSTKAQIGNSDGDFSVANPLPITGSISTTPGATFFASDAILSVNVIQSLGSNTVVGSGYQDNALRVVQATDSVSSVAAAQVGTWTISSITNSTAAALVDSTGVAYSGSNPFPVTITSGGTATSATNIVDSSGVAYSGSNPVPVTFSPAGSQNINVFDGQASTITSHQDTTGDFRGLDTTTIRTVNVESALNSSTTVLANGGTFTGLAEDIKDYAVIQVNVFSDQTSATDGLSIQQSSNGTNWDITDVYTVPASTGKTFSFQAAARYYRVVYTNGATLQGSFRLQSVLHQTVSKNSSQRPGDALSNENDFEQVSAYLSGLNSSGNWDRIRTNSGTADGALRVVLATDATYSVNVVSDAVTLSDTTDTIGTQQVSGAVDSVFVVGPIAQGDSTSAMRIIQAGDSSSSVAASQVGTWNITTLTGITNTLASNIIDSSGVAYSGSNPVPMTIISGALTSTLSVGDSSARTADNGGNPVKVGGIARTTNPTAYADGDRVNFGSDKMGRQLIRNIQVRELLATAYTTVSTGTETTILTAGAGTYLDCIWMLFANTSSAAQQIDVRAVSAGNIVHTAYIPAQSSVGWAPPVPWPQDATGNAWTVDNSDVTNSTVFITSLFSKEV